MGSKTVSTYSALLTVGACIILILGFGVVPATAVSVTTTDIPREAEPGDRITATLTVNQLYESYEQWTLMGETELTSARWTILARNQAGNQVDQRTIDGSSSRYDVDIVTGIAQLRIELSGTVPSQRGSSTSFVFAQLSQEASTVEQEEETVVVTTAEHTVIHTVIETSVEEERAVIGTWRVDYTQSAPATNAGQDDESEATSIPTRTKSDGATAEAEVQRGFFVNNPNPDNPLSGLGSSHITAIGFLLSVVGILLELRGGS